MPCKIAYNELIRTHKNLKNNNKKKTVGSVGQLAAHAKHGKDVFVASALVWVMHVICRDGKASDLIG